MFPRILTFAAIPLLILNTPLRAAEDEKAAFDKSKAADGGLGMPTPYDKFIALDQTLSKTKVDWAKLARSLGKSIDTDEFKDAEVGVPLALGIRIADGIMTVKAKDAELLNKCAADIEKLAKKLGISDSEMSRARAVRTAANKGDWLKVFMELGFFQQDILTKLEAQKNPTRTTLIIAAGWMQGARYTARAIDENYSSEASNILREPVLAKNLTRTISTLPSEVKSSPKVTQLSGGLEKIAKIIDIPIDGEISQDNVKKISSLTTTFVESACNPKR